MYFGRGDMMSNICLNTKIWDLHIHTNLCAKSTGDFKRLTTHQYIDKIKPYKLFDHHEELEMISFTDHNRINIDVYNEFLKRNHRIKLLPGIEVDVDFGDAKKSKTFSSLF